jgi:type IV pilus assembly PilO-like protein
VTLSDRDRRILLILIPIVVVVAYWFLILSPKRSDLTAARSQQHQAEQARDQAVAQAAQLEKARASFATDYAAVVKLGKAIPDTVDAPSLLVQLDTASKGTHIDFQSVTFGARTPSTTPIPTVPTSGPEQPEGNAAAGGAPAQTGFGKATEAAGNAVTTANQASTAAGGDTSTTTTTTTTTAAPSTTAPSLDTVALTFNFQGSYFDLADFFHRLKRFVYARNNQIFVRGRLMTIDTLSFSNAGTSTTTGKASNQLIATVGATVYLSPASQGVTGGATPQGPAGTTTSPTTTTPAGSQTSNVPLATQVP